MGLLDDLFMSWLAEKMAPSSCVLPHFWQMTSLSTSRLKVEEEATPRSLPRSSRLRLDGGVASSLLVSRSLRLRRSRPLEEALLELLEVALLELGDRSFLALAAAGSPLLPILLAAPRLTEGEARSCTELASL